jgi:hypothetical protein
MAVKSTKNSKSGKNDYQSKQLRRNQIIFSVVAVILILSMALALVKF